MLYRIRIEAANVDIVIPTSELEQLGEAIQLFIKYGFRDGVINHHGVLIEAREG